MDYQMIIASFFMLGVMGFVFYFVYSMKKMADIKDNK